MYVVYYVDTCRGCRDSDHKPHAWGTVEVTTPEIIAKWSTKGPITDPSDSVWMVPGTVSPLDD